MAHYSNKSHYSFQTIGIEQIKAHYLFTEKDSAILTPLLPIAKASLEEMQKAFYSFIFNFEHAKMFLSDDEIIQKHRYGIATWYLALFEGVYDNDYFEMLGNISETHVKIGLPSHYVNAAFSFVRQFLEKLLIETGNTAALPAMHKIIDINLDILSLTYKHESQQKLIKNIALIKKAIRENSVEPYVQPIFEKESGDISHYECLMRIHDRENRTTCSILHMLELSKEIMLYDKLMEQMIVKSFDIFRSLPHAFTINLSFEDISDANFRHFLKAQLQSIPNPKRVVFEILESDMITDYHIVKEFIKEVKRFGCTISIDDFGSGYSNMENILKLNPDYIKIDGSLIQNIDHSQESLKLVKNILNIAKDIQAKTVAEYVHNKAVYDTLQSLDIDYLQGYYLAEPFPASTLLVS